MKFTAEDCYCNFTVQTISSEANRSMRANGCELSHVCEAMKNYFLQHHFLGGPSQQKSPHCAHHHTAQPGTARGAFGGSNMARPCKALRAWLEQRGSTGLSGGQSKELHLFGSAMDPTLTHLMASPWGIGHLTHQWITKSGNQLQ